MATLINGNGNPAVYAAQDSDFIASIMGNQTSITAVGNQFAYNLEDANTISVADGVIITKEGRRIQLDASEVDLFTIPTGAQGTTSYYIIGYELYTTDASEQKCNTFVELMEDGTSTIQEDTFRGGADTVKVSLYRVTQTGLTITSVDLLLPTIGNISGINTDLTANSKKFTASYQNNKYGFSIDGNFYEIGGGGMPVLNFANPIKTFLASDTYTAQDGDYLYISALWANTNTTTEISIDGKACAKGSNEDADRRTIKLGAGQVITSDASMNASVSVVFILREVQ